MKLVRFGEKGREKPGLVDREGAIRDLSGQIGELAGEALDPAALRRLSGLDPAALPKVDGPVRLGPPVAGTRNFIAIGLNYADHAAETNAPVPKEPIVFNKAPSSIQGPDDEVIIPRDSVKTDWEVELAVVIGRRTSYVEESAALDNIAGYCVCNDLSERAWQIEGTGQWTKGKSAETFGPLGPWLVTPDEIPDPLALDMFLDLNGERMQGGSTRTMIFGPAFVVSYLSRFMVLEPGDVITTGTPPGVGMARGRFLKPGDQIRLGIAGLSEQNQRVRGYEGA